MFIFAFIWSLCCTVDYSGRKLFDKKVRELITLNCPDVKFPEEGTVYDYEYI